MLKTLSLFAFVALNVALVHGSCGPNNDYPTGHTMCETDVGTELVMSQADKDDVLDRHNVIRGNLTVNAANMAKLVWDDKLALVAGKWARQCQSGHDENDARLEPAYPGVHIGQNAAAGYSSVLEATNAWFAEYVNFTYGEYLQKKVGHYTQQIWAKTARVGCGMADCSSVSSYGKFQVCNYAVGQMGTWETIAKNPYVNSTNSCADCPTSCESASDLCDCGGELCYNEGTLDIDSCTCTCPGLYTGDNCETKDCPENDSQCDMYISFIGNDTQTLCQYDNVRNEICTKRCCDYVPE